jgi:amino acid permease
MALATIAFAYGGNVVYPEVESTMRKPSDWKKVMSGAMISCSIMYLAVAIVGYLAYGENVQSPILDSLPSGFIRTVGLILITLHVVLAVPISICSFSMEWERHFHVSLNYMSPLKQFGFRALIRTLTVFSLTVVALIIPFFNTLMSLIGAVSNCIMVFIFPLLCHLKLFGFRNRSILDYIILIVSIFVGTLGCILGAIQSIQALIDDLNGIPHKGGH